MSSYLLLGYGFPACKPDIGVVYWRGMSPEFVAESVQQVPGTSPGSATRGYTYSQICAEFPESNQPGELWDRALVMSPSRSFSHQEIVLRFYRHLYDWVDNRGLGKVITAPIDMVLSEHRVTQPDVLFISKERSGVVQRVVTGPADLICEVVSLGSRNRDRIEKRDLYEQYGVEEYWIIDPEARTVDVLHLQAGRYDLVVRAGIGEVAESRYLPGFRCGVSQLLSA